VPWRRIDYSSKVAYFLMIDTLTTVHDNWETDPKFKEAHMYLKSIKPDTDRKLKQEAMRNFLSKIIAQGASAQA
jgi:hypothetical protein